MGRGTDRPAKPKLSEYDVTRHISLPVTAMLWGRAGGRCEFAGCNRPLWMSLVTRNEVNVAQKAHIRSFSPYGPRGRQGISKEQLNATENLMLVCHQCHTEIDGPHGEQTYSAELLLLMKKRHEDRVELVTGIAPEHTSNVLLYGSNIGDQSPCLSYKQAAAAMMPGRFPASRNPLALQLLNVASNDTEETFWANEDANLKKLFEKKVRGPLSEPSADKHLSVFALAAQPLLVRLGTLLGDIFEVDVFQRHREPQTWDWPQRAERLKIKVERPQNSVGIPALLVDISARVTRDRVHQALAEEAAVWQLTVEDPHNDIIKSREHLADFRATLRPLLNMIKEKHGQNTMLHVFLAAPVSICVEFGRVRMPKADMPWLLYDHHNVHGYKPALKIA